MRGAERIGAGLAPAREARAIRVGERIHVVGAAGAGASAAALLARAAGAVVSGCDPGGPSPYTPPLVAAGVELDWQHAAAHVMSGAAAPPVRLAVTKALTAIHPDHPELRAARDAGIPIEPWQQLVADAAVGRRLVAVAGTHGKSTTAGWLVHVLARAGLDPAAFVGALLPATVTGGLAATARLGRGDAFVVEADEYAGNFDPFRPAVTVLTSAEWDHPDVFADRNAVVAAFEAWIRTGVDLRHGPPMLVANAGDDGVAEVLERLGDWPGRVISTRVEPAVGPDSDGATRYQQPASRPRPASELVARVIDEGPVATTIEIDGLTPDRSAIRVALPTAGRHNVANALGVAGAALALGVPSEAIVAGLESFEGVGRRLERKGEARGVVVYDDYGHHPTAIRATIAAVRQREPGRRLWAVYEPLTFHRTAALLDEFAAALAAADAVAVSDIWAGRDPDTTIASASRLVDAVSRERPGRVAVAPGSVEATADWLAGHVAPGDAVLVMGGGRSYRIAELLLDGLTRG